MKRCDEAFLIPISTQQKYTRRRIEEEEEGKEFVAQRKI